MCIRCAWPTHPRMRGILVFSYPSPIWQDHVWKGDVIGENQTKSRFIEPRLDLIGSLMEKESGRHEAPTLFTKTK